MVLTLVLSVLLVIATALVLALVTAVKRTDTPAADPPAPTLTVTAGPGWYAERDGSKRYWDGSHWTGIVREASFANDVGDGA